MTRRFPLGLSRHRARVHGVHEGLVTPACWHDHGSGIHKAESSGGGHCLSAVASGYGLMLRLSDPNQSHEESLLEGIEIKPSETRGNNVKECQQAPLSTILCSWQRYNRSKTHISYPSTSKEANIRHCDTTLCHITCRSTKHRALLLSLRVCARYS